MNVLLTPLKLRRKAEESAAAFPALLLKAEKVANAALHGTHARRKAGPGEKFWQFREYDTSDRPQDIDWRQSGKTQHIYIRQKERQAAQSAIFWCAGGDGMNFSSHRKIPTKAESAHILTLALALLFTRAGEQVGLAGIPGWGRTEKTLQKMAEALCTQILPTPAHIAKNATFIAIGDFLDPIEEITKNFETLAAQAENGIVIQVLDPAELELPYTGRAIFERPGGEDETINNVESIRAAYRSRITAHTDSVEKLCTKLGWLYVLHRTDKPPENTIREIREAFS